ncbi:MAG: BMC domain-containing protein [Desulfosarcina sp.]|nr:BMC domain-containing protein [Desulfosarcina sp.]MBC2743598.1 BMC domain-containing protein [Desulfosarcina sp.]MBC2766507.1 BMC domain-containing protein [Desulfosarcina sp.]
MITAIGVVELSSIAKGFEVADSLLKHGKIKIIVNRTICPGKFMILIGGEVDAVKASMHAGLRIGAHTVVDHLVIPNIDSAVFPAISGVAHVPEIKSLGIIESFTISSVIEAAHTALKAARIKLINIHLAMAIGGKAYVSLTGDVGAVKAAVKAGAAVIEKKGLLVNKVVIPSPRKEIINEFI